MGVALPSRKQCTAPKSSNIANSVGRQWSGRNGTSRASRWLSKVAAECPKAPNDRHQRPPTLPHPNRLPPQLPYPLSCHQHRTLSGSSRPASMLSGFSRSCGISAAAIRQPSDYWPGCWAAGRSSQRSTEIGRRRGLVTRASLRPNSSNQRWPKCTANDCWKQHIAKM